MPKHFSEDLKLKAVEYFVNTNNQSKTCRIFGCSRRSLIRWKNKYDNDNGRILRYNRDAVSYKVRKPHVRYILRKIKENNNITMDQLLADFHDRFDDVELTRQWLGRIIRDNNITRKRIKTKHFPETRFGFPFDIQDKLDEFYRKTDSLDIRNIISIDETSIRPDMSLHYARCKLGQRCYRKTTNNLVFKKYTLLVAISNRGVIGWRLYESGAMSGERFAKFLNDFIVGKYQNKTIVMDNAGAHRTNIVKNTITNSGNSYLYTVPYRPQTNPIEEWFSQLKHYLKLDPALRFGQIKRSVARSINKIKREHHRNYFRHAYRSRIYRNYDRKDSTLKRAIPKYKD